MKKTIITTTLAISALGFAFAQAQVEAMPAREIQRANITKAKAVLAPSVATTQAMPAMQGGNMMDFMTTGDKNVDDKVRTLMKERDEKMKALQEEYQAKIKALLGERKLMPKGQNDVGQGTQKRLDNTQGREGAEEAYKKKMEVEQQRIERMKNNPNAPVMPVMMIDKEGRRGEVRGEMMEAKEVEAPVNPFSRIQGMFKGVFNR